MTAALFNMALVVGGIASGKSHYGEQLAIQTGLVKTYIATAQMGDDEMRIKIAAHQDRRGKDWVLQEAPFDIAAALPARGVCLLDCATMWLSNHLLAEHDLDKECDVLLQALDRHPHPIVIISNEVGQGGIGEHRLMRKFQNAQGRLNQMLAAQADLVIKVEMGLPNILKGEQYETGLVGAPRANKAF